jgi:hypothetical protein
MKKTLLSLALAAGFLTIGCDHPSSAKNEQEITPETLKHILLHADAARHYIRIFDSICREKLGDTPIRAFTIRYQDLFAAMGIPEIDSNQVTHKCIRVYLGYDTSDHVHAGFKLLLVPVDSAYIGGDNKSNWFSGFDVLLDSSGKAIRYVPSSTTVTPYVLDLNAPCPNTCSTNSAIN